MNILISTNKKYIEPAKTMLASLRNHTAESITVYLLNHRLAEREIEDLKKYLQKKCNIDLITIDMNIPIIDAMPEVGYFSTEIYYRIVAQYVLPEELERILWLDADIIVNGDLTTFYYQDFDDKCMVVCPNALEHEDIKENMGIASEHIYFNSGVLLINLAKLRSYISMDEICRICEEKKDKLINPDQDLLNYIYQNQVKYADETIYNFQMHIRHGQSIEDTRIIHYTGENKPWSSISYDYMNNYWKVRLENGDLLGYMLFIVRKAVRSFKKLMKRIVNKFIPAILKDNIRYALAYQKREKIYKNHKSKESINIVFVVYRASVWNSSKSTYRYASEQKNINTYIVVMPTYKNGYIEEKDRQNIEYISSTEIGNIIEAYDAESGAYFDISQLEPDYIFLDLPYDSASPKQMKMSELSKIAKLCYIPYGYTILKSDMQKSTISESILQFTTYLFAECNIVYRYCRHKLWLSEIISGKRIYNIGYPRFDLYGKEDLRMTANHLTLMWLPRWTTGKDVKEHNNEPSSFFENKDKILKYAELFEEDSVIIRPHPLAFDNYIKNGMMTEDEVKEYKNRIEALDNVRLDCSSSYYEGLIEADVLISDFSSIIAEYFVTGKPILYFGSGKNFPKEHSEMYDSFYHVSSWEDAEAILKALKNGDDPKRDQRRIAVENFRKGKEKNVGKQIIDLIVADARKA